MNQRPPARQSSAWNQVGLAMSIPTLMVAGPLVGYLLAKGLERLTGWDYWWLNALLIALGFAAGIRETIKVIRKLS